MAALRQLLNARGTEAKMAALGYQISAPQVPEKSEADRSRQGKTGGDAPSKTLHSKFSSSDSTDQLGTTAWQHPLLRKDQAAEKSQDYGRGNSFDDAGGRPHHLIRSATDNSLQTPGNRMDDNGFSMDVSSIYEDNESPALSPALNKHLALRPLNTATIQQTQEEPASYRPAKQRRRSRSATQDSATGYYAGDPWESYRKDPPSATKPRKESLQSSSKPSEESSTGRERQRSPAQLQKSKYDPNANSTNNAIKVAHNTFSSTSSPTDSATNSISERQNPSPEPASSHTHPVHSNKRKRSLDYRTPTLTEMDYVQDLQPESFDTFPALAQLASTHDLPSPTLPLHDRLRNICNTPAPHTANTAPTHPSNDKAARARAFFASLSIDEYDECGDLLLDGFRDVMDRLRQARREKRQAAQEMEELVARREEWVRRKRGVLEGELGRLRGAGVAVVKPTQTPSRR